MNKIDLFFKLLTDINNWNIDSILTLVSIFFAIIGGSFAFHQWRISNKIKRTEFINQMIEKLRFDKDMVKIMHEIDYTECWYNQDFHGNSELEYPVDKLLSYLSYICYIFKLKNIGKKEFSILRYEVDRVCSSRSIQNYLWNLYHFSKSQNTLCTFQYQIDYGIEHKLICKKNFMNEDSELFEKYLNF